MQAFAPQLSVAARNCKQSVYTYSSKRSRTRTFSASATSCKRPTVISRRPFIQLFTVWRVTPIMTANSPSLTFFSPSLCAGSAATHTFLFSLLVCFKMFILIASPPELAVRLRFDFHISLITPGTCPRGFDKDVSADIGGVKCRRRQNRSECVPVCRKSSVSSVSFSSHVISQSGCI